MTLQDLKDNKQAIIDLFFAYGCAQNKLVEFMTGMKEMMEEGMMEDNETPLDYVNSRLREKETLKYYRTGKVSVSSMVSSMNDHKTFNHVTKSYN